MGLSKKTKMPFINVQDFGAIGNGVTDDTAAIQDAINYGFDHNIRKVVIPSTQANVYITTKTIALPHNMELCGEGDVKIKKDTNTGYGGTRWTDLSSCDAVIGLTSLSGEYEGYTMYQSIHDITLSGCTTQYVSGKTSLQAGIGTAGNVAKVNISRVKTSQVDVGIDFDSSWFTSIRECKEIAGFYYGIRFLNESQGVNIQNVNVVYPAHAAYYLNACHYGVLQSCLAEWMGGDTNAVAYDIRHSSVTLLDCGVELSSGLSHYYAFSDSVVNMIGCAAWVINGTLKDNSNDIVSDISIGGGKLNVIGYRSYCYTGDSTNKPTIHPATNGLVTNWGGAEVTISDVMAQVPYKKAVHFSGTENATFKFGNGVYTTNDEAFKMLGRGHFFDENEQTFQTKETKAIVLNSEGYPTNNRQYYPALKQGDFILNDYPMLNGVGAYIVLNDIETDVQTIESISEIKETNGNTMTVYLTSDNLENTSSNGVKLRDYLYKKAQIGDTTAIINSVYSAWDKETGYYVYLVDIADTTAITTGYTIKVLGSERNDFQYNRFGCLQVVMGGHSDSRPTINSELPVGFMYFDQTLNKPIWYNGENWVDATGTTV